MRERRNFNNILSSGFQSVLEKIKIRFRFQFIGISNVCKCFFHFNFHHSQLNMTFLKKDHSKYEKNVR